MNKVLYSSNKDDWETPKDLFNKLNKIFKFNLDLCASDSNHLCTKYFTKDNSCFDYKNKIKNYNIFCNPPYR